ncbi:Crp/Fnr family transcriptional regulator [Puia sp. P3]|uniref:Crp/Fnr family transcriptional regulator n=1 Tax=Puia sp. P3 TaxID=3423952 RepID=UPI003D664C0E
MYDQVTEFIRQRVTVPEDALQEAFSRSRMVHYKKGDIILRAGEYCRFIGFLNTGLIMVTVTDEAGKEAVCSFFFEKEFFTYVEGIQENIPSDKNFVALEDCQLLLLSKNELPAIFSLHPAFEALFNKVILEGLRRVIGYAQAQHTLSVEERYLHLMERQPELFSRIPLKVIANYLGVAPPASAACEKDWRRREKLTEVKSRLTGR